MHTTNLRKVGGSIMLTVPPALLDILHLKAGTTVGISVDSGHLIVEPRPSHRYTLDELLNACDASIEITAEERQWLDAPAVGGELL